MSAQDETLKRLREIAQNPNDPALDIILHHRAFKGRADFCRELGVVLDALEAYHK